MLLSLCSTLDGQGLSCYSLGWLLSCKRQINSNHMLNEFCAQGPCAAHVSGLAVPASQQMRPSMYDQLKAPFTSDSPRAWAGSRSPHSNNFVVSYQGQLSFVAPSSHLQLL